MREILKLGAILAAISLVAGLLLSGTYSLTRPRIRMQEEEERGLALKQVLPGAVEFREKRGRTMRYEEGVDRSGRVVGYAFDGQAKGYQSTIRVRVGVDPDGKILGIKILSQEETPGLGAKVDEVLSQETLWSALMGIFRSSQPVEIDEIPSSTPWFQAQFAGKTARDLILVKESTDKNIESITGATITSQAVTKAVRDSVREFLTTERGGEP